MHESIWNSYAAAGAESDRMGDGTRPKTEGATYMYMYSEYARSIASSSVQMTGRYALTAVAVVLLLSRDVTAGGGGGGAAPVDP